MTDERLVEFIDAFHGHVGPYVVLGARAGALAVERLSARKGFGIEAVVYAPPKPPPSCFIDGVQIGSGCTMGNRNIRHDVAEMVGARFRNTDTGAALRIDVDQAIVAEAVRRLRAEGDRAGAGVILGAPEHELFRLAECAWE